jgi:hypothetical protein
VFLNNERGRRDRARPTRKAGNSISSGFGSVQAYQLEAMINLLERKGFFGNAVFMPTTTAYLDAHTVIKQGVLSETAGESHRQGV